MGRGDSELADEAIDVTVCTSLAVDALESDLSSGKCTAELTGLETEGAYAAHIELAAAG